MGVTGLAYGTNFVISPSFMKTLAFGTEDSKKRPPFVPFRELDIERNTRSASLEGSAMRLNSSRAFALSGMPE